MVYKPGCISFWLEVIQPKEQKFRLINIQSTEAHDIMGVKKACKQLWKSSKIT